MGQEDYIKAWGSGGPDEDAQSLVIGLPAMWAEALAMARERYARRLIEARLPRHLGWLIDRPRALRWIYKLRPAWRPSMSVIPLRPDSTTPPMTTTYATARSWAERWLVEARAKGCAPTTDGLIFPHTAVDGTPREVYGDWRR
jgi:hypothetical protein